MSVEDAIAAAQSFSAALDARFESERKALEARAAEAKAKLASGLLDLKERATPAAAYVTPEAAYATPEAASASPEAAYASPEAAYDSFASNGATEAPEGADFDPFAFDQNGVAAPRGVSFDDFASAPQPNLDMPPGEDDVLLDDDGIPTWQEP